LISIASLRATGSISTGKLFCVQISMLHMFECRDGDRAPCPLG
jgi:hypothetical protein